MIRVAVLLLVWCLALSFSKEVVHPPFQTGDCSICHIKTAEGYTETLNMKLPDLCYLCHADKKESWLKKKVIHTPVKGGACTLCHNPHKSKTPKLLRAPSVNDLCTSCHPSVARLLKKPQVHSAVKLLGCTACHDPHAENNELRLRMPRTEICFMCHIDKKEYAERVKNRHGAIFIRSRCLNCHNPHGSDHPKNLKADTPMKVCLSCHDKVMAREEDGKVIRNMAKHFAENKDPHGPNQWGDCAMCHNPHGSDNYRMLKRPFPPRFYSSFDKDNYICFMCHDPAPFLNKETTSTGFRNGKKSLHWVHVNKSKGITCRDCHDWHATNGLPHHLKEYTEFGKVKFPLNYRPTKNGGFCGPLCHPRRGYDRVRPVVNPR